MGLSAAQSSHLQCPLRYYATNSTRKKCKQTRLQSVPSKITYKPTHVLCQIVPYNILNHLRTRKPSHHWENFEILPFATAKVLTAVTPPCAVTRRTHIVAMCIQLLCWVY